jgi:hypothetical protein
MDQGCTWAGNDPAACNLNLQQWRSDTSQLSHRGGIVAVAVGLLASVSAAVCGQGIAACRAVVGGSSCSCVAVCGSLCVVVSQYRRASAAVCGQRAPSRRVCGLWLSVLPAGVDISSGCLTCLGGCLLSCSNQSARLSRSAGEDANSKVNISLHFVALWR